MTSTPTESNSKENSDPFPGRRRAIQLGIDLSGVGVAVGKYIFGALCAMSIFTSILVVGWAQRASRREILRRWFLRSPEYRPSTFREFVISNQRIIQFSTWPNWLFSNEPLLDGHSFGSVWKKLFGSLIANFTLGIQASFNIAVFVVPGGLLWSFGWYAGWMNSFHKGYENYFVGILTYSIGIMLFIAGVLYSPMATARQASTGDWKSFYDFLFIWKLIQRRWLGQLTLAVLAVALAFPMNVLRVLPQFFPQIDPSILDLSASDQLLFLHRYFFLTAFYGVPAFVAFKLAAARIYASALVDAVQTGAISHDELSDWEWECLHELKLLSTVSTRSRHWMLKLVRWVGTRAGRTTAIATTIIAWLGFILNVMTAEFFNYHEYGRGWWNQPLILLPWLDYTPESLTTAASAETSALGSH
jgi:hypothetical protein